MLEIGGVGPTVETAQSIHVIPQSGEIDFSSPLFEDLRLKHALQYCNGNDIFN